MFSKLISNLFAPRNTDAAAQNDERLPLAVLMVRLARTDSEYVLEERAEIELNLADRFGMSQIDARKLVDEAEQIEAEHRDNVEYTRQIKDVVPHDTRAEIMVLMWSLVLADGTRDNEENGFLRLITALLGLSDQESAFARQRAQEKLR